jgi:hypothetical protein
MFISPDEHILLTGGSKGRNGKGIDYTPCELTRLVDCGVRTRQIWLYWQHLEPKKGVYNWSYPDKVIDECQKAGIKLIIFVPASAPSFFPASWYLKYANGQFLNNPGHHGMRIGLSYWNKEAMDYRDRFTEMVCRRYNSDTVLCASSFLHQGETFMAGKDVAKLDGAAICDDAAVASLQQYLEGLGVPLEPNFWLLSSPHTIQWLHDTYTEFALRNQRIYAATSQHKELWQQLHWAYSDEPRCGTELLAPLYLKAQQETGCEVHQIFTEGYSRPLKTPLKLMSEGVKNIWMGACWADGLKRNTPSAIQNGFRGLYCAALHPFVKLERMEEWQFENFKWANQQWGKT